jgi:hypothetical protein
VITVCFTTFCICLTAALFPTVAWCVKSTAVVVNLRDNFNFYNTERRVLGVYTYGLKAGHPEFDSR